MKNNIKWPNGKKCAAMITVNLDAEYFGRIYYPEMDCSDGDVYRLGQTSIKFGLPKMLDLFDQYGVKATFFVPGAVALEYSESVAEIHRRGHEIGCHGLNHEVLGIMGTEEQRQVLNEATEILKRISGQMPIGFRMPEGEISETTLKIVKELGYSYSSSLSDDDVPYIREESGLLEIPIHWELFDLPYFVFTFDPPIPSVQSRSARMDDVLENWRIELQGAKKFGTLFNLQLDPQATGEQGRIFMAEEIIKEILNDSDIWLATGRDVAELFKN